MDDENQKQQVCEDSVKLGTDRAIDINHVHERLFKRMNTLKWMIQQNCIIRIARMKLIVLILVMPDLIADVE
jgi:hypothetical protein